VESWEVWAGQQHQVAMNKLCDACVMQLMSLLSLVTVTNSQPRG